jgi:hypothetical protein
LNGWEVSGPNKGVVIAMVVRQSPQDAAKERRLRWLNGISAVLSLFALILSLVALVSVAADLLESVAAVSKHINFAYTLRFYSGILMLVVLALGIWAGVLAEQVYPGELLIVQLEEFVKKCVVAAAVELGILLVWMLIASYHATYERLFGSSAKIDALVSHQNQIYFMTGNVLVVFLVALALAIPAWRSLENDKRERREHEQRRHYPEHYRERT